MRVLLLTSPEPLQLFTPPTHPHTHTHARTHACILTMVACLHVAQVLVSQEGNDQVIRLTTDLEAGRLLLHWGVEGGKDYKGGWRLPGNNCRPEGTQQYKDRALQTPFRWGFRRCSSFVWQYTVAVHRLAVVYCTARITLK